MSRSAKKGPFVDERLLKRIQDMPAGSKTVLKTWSRRSVISPEMVGHNFSVHNGRDFLPVYVTEGMVGCKLGEFAPSTKFKAHGGKIAKEQAKTANAVAAMPVASAAPASEGGKKK